MRLDKMTITAVWSFSVVFMFWGLSADDASDKVSRWRRNEGGFEQRRKDHGEI